MEAEAEEVHRLTLGARGAEAVVQSSSVVVGVRSVQVPSEAEEERSRRQEVEVLVESSEAAKEVQFLMEL